VSTELFFAWNELVDCLVAVVAQVDGFVHLVAAKAFLEPLVAVAGAGNQMVFVSSPFSKPPAQFALLSHRWFFSFFSCPTSYFIRLSFVNPLDGEYVEKVREKHAAKNA
jgi:hypothetical protein